MKTMILRHENKKNYVQLHCTDKGWQVQAGRLDGMFDSVKWECGWNAGIVIGTYAMLRVVLKRLNPEDMLPNSEIVPWNEDFKFVLYVGMLTEGYTREIEEVLNELEDVNLNMLRKGQS